MPIPSLTPPTMTGYELRLWRRQMAWDQAQAAAALGVGLRTYKRYELADADRAVRRAQPLPDLVTRAAQQITLAAMLPALARMDKAQILQQLQAILGAPPAPLHPQELPPC